MEVVQLDDPLEAGLQVAILFEHPLILGADGLLDSDDLAATGPYDGNDLDGAALFPQSFPQAAVRCGSGAERLGSLVSRIDEDED